MSIDLNGWNLVAGITYDDVNAAIVKGNSSPKTFNVVSTDPTTFMNGTFGTWSLVRGVPLSQNASGEDITVQIPVTGGSLTLNNVAGPITACTVTARILASYIPQPPNLKALVPAQQSTVPAKVNSSTPQQSSFLRESAFEQLLGQWLQDNLGSFNQVFAVVDMEADFSQVPGLTWMQPTYLGYATQEPIQLPGQPVPKSVFAVLALVDGEAPTASTINTVSSGVIPTGADAGLLISTGKFLKYFMLPGAPYMFDGQPNAASSFRLDNNQLQITSTVDLNLVEVSLENGKKVKPAVPATQFSIDVVNTELHINVNQASYVPSLGFEASIYYKGRYTVSLDATNRILDLTDVFHESGGSCEAAQGYFITELAMGVVAAVMGIVGGVAGGVSRAATLAVDEAANAANVGGAAANGVQNAQQAGNAILTCCKGLISGTAQELGTLAARLKTVMKISLIGAAATGLTGSFMGIAHAIINGNFSSAPKLDDVTDTAVGKIIKWPTTIGTHKLASAQLNGCLQLGLTNVP